MGISKKENYRKLFFAVVYVLAVDKLSYVTSWNSSEPLVLEM